jgi:hypothetical protein
MLALTTRSAPPSYGQESLKCGRRNSRGELRHSPLRELSGHGQHGWAGRRSGIGAAWFQPLIVCDRRSTETYSSQRLSPPSALQNQGQNFQRAWRTDDGRAMDHLYAERTAYWSGVIARLGGLIILFNSAFGSS